MLGGSRAAPLRDRPVALQGLLEELEDFLLDAVGLGQSADTGLGEDLVLGQVGGSLAVVGCGDGVLRGGEVDLFGAGHVGG